MLMKIINSGSDGNCVVLTDTNKNQLVLDCGLPYKIIAPNLDMANLNAILLSHY